MAEAWRNLIAVGAKPLAITDCLNFGNPQRPEIMAQLVGCIEGMAEACRALDFPVVSGNVSLYNETDGTGILPTPAVGAVGLIDDYARTMTMGFKARGGDDHRRRMPQPIISASRFGCARSTAVRTARRRKSICRRTPRRAR